MNSELCSACKCYGLYDENNIIGFMGVLHQPHGTHKNLKRVSRLVILPDYQGIGLGTKFLEIIAQLYTNKGYDFSIVTSAKNMIYSLNKNPRWKCVRYGKNSCSNDKNKIDYNRKSIRTNCKTASFMYRKNKQ